MAYLLIITNLYCNHQCSYCIQTKSSLDVRKNPNQIDVGAVLTFLKSNRIAHSVKVMGGEATLHPRFEELMEGFLRLYRKIVITTDLNGKWFRNFDKALKKINVWGKRVQWNTTYHPSWMEADVYIERIRALRSDGINLCQVASTDTNELTEETSEKLHKANIGWSLQTYTGRDVKGRLLPQTWDDINSNYPQLYDPSKYIDNYDEYIQECEDANYVGTSYREELVICDTSRFLIGPDNNVYPCHRHLYAGDKNYVCGSIYDTEMKNFRFKWHRFTKKWVLPCDRKCNPCDFKSVKIKKTGELTRHFISESKEKEEKVADV